MTDCVHEIVSLMEIADDDDDDENDIDNNGVHDFIHNAQQQQQQQRKQQSDDVNNNNDIFPFRVGVTMSRPIYRIGGTIVGTVRLTPLRPTRLPPPPQPTTTTTNSEKIKATSVELETKSSSLLFQDTTTTNASAIIRESIDSLLLFVVGYCRLDPRWHGPKDHLRLLQYDNDHNQNHGDDDDDTTVPKDIPIPFDYTTPIWVSRPIIDLINDLPERPYGSWVDVQPRPIAHSLNPQNIDSADHGWNDSMNTIPTKDSKHNKKNTDNNNNNNNNQNTIRLENQQLAFTFRIDIPTTIPPTFVGKSCRYFYTIALRIQPKLQQHLQNTSTSSDNHLISPKPYWIHVPVNLYTPIAIKANNISNNIYDTHGDYDNNNTIPGSELSCQAIAHSSGLPCYLSATELHFSDENEGQFTVHRNGSSLYRHLHFMNTHTNTTTNNNTNANHGIAASVQSMKVVDPTTGKPACFLTMIGVTNIHPGSRILLKLDFPTPIRPISLRKSTVRNKNYNDNDADTLDQDWIQCYQASACLQGEEIAIRCSSNSNTTNNTTYKNSNNSNSNNAKTRIRAQKYLFDTAHTMIDPWCTESVTLDLVVPTSAPCTMETESVQVSIQCIIDISVGADASRGPYSREDDNRIIKKYRNLHLEIPCHISHPLTAWECEKMIGEDDTSNPSDVYVDDDGCIQGQQLNPYDYYDKVLMERSQELRAKEKNTKSDEEERIATTILDRNEPHNFRTKDIMDELKILSLTMADECNLIPKPTYPSMTE